MTQARIRSAFETRLSAWAAARVPALPVAWEDVAADMPTADHLRAFLLPSPTTSRDVMGLHRSYRGVFQVSVFCPPGGGAAKSEAIAAELAALFTYPGYLVDASFTTRILSPMSISAAIEEPAWRSIAATWRYGADTI